VKSLITLDKYAVLVVGANVQSCQVSGGQTKRRGQQQLDRSSSRVLRWQVHRSATVSICICSIAHTDTYICMYVEQAGQAATVTWSLFTASHATRTVFAIKMDLLALLQDSTQHTTYNTQHTAHVGTHFFQRRQINCPNFCQPLTFYFVFKCFNRGAGQGTNRSMDNMCKPGPDDTFEYYFLQN